MWSEEKSKIARRCGEKHILKSKCAKHVSVGTLFEVLMSKNCTPLWRKAHSEVKMLKKKLRGLGALFEVLMSKNCTPLWREAHLEVRMHKPLMLGALFEVLTSKNCTRLWRKAHFEVKTYKKRQQRTTF